MGTKGEAYVDTSAFIAFVDRSDSYHDLFRRLFDDPPSLVTSVQVVAEGHAWFLRRYDTYRALQFLSLIEEMEPLEVLDTKTADVEQATTLLRQVSDQRLTLTDAIGLSLMRLRDVEVCWSTDFHMGSTGISLAIHGV